MKNKYGTLRYQAKREMITVIGLLLFMFVLVAIPYKLGVVKDLGSLLVTTISMSECMGIDHRSYMRHKEYIVFGFSRKRFYKEQVIICLLRVAVISIYMVLMHTIYYEGLIENYAPVMEEKIEMYHRIPVVEDFLVCFCMLMIINLIFLIKNTWVYRSQNKVLQRVSISPQLAGRIQEKKEKKIAYKISNVLYQIGNVIFIFTTILWYMLCQEKLFRSTRIYMWRLIVVLTIVGVVLYFIGKRRFKPEYI